MEIEIGTGLISAENHVFYHCAKLQCCNQRSFSVTGIQFHKHNYIAAILDFAKNRHTKSKSELALFSCDLRIMNSTTVPNFMVET